MPSPIGRPPPGAAGIVPAEVRGWRVPVKHAIPALEENGDAEERADAALAEHGVRQLGVGRRAR